MAKTMIERVVDDLDGSPDAKTVSFAWAGTSYEIDLSEKNASALHDALAPYLAVARRAAGRRAVRGPAPTPSTRSSRLDVNAVRSWARAHDHQVSDRGRIANDVIEAYRAYLATSAGAADAGTDASRPARKATARSAAKKTPARKATIEKAPAEKSAAKKAAATRSATENAPAKKAATKTAATKTAATKTATENAPARKSAAKPTATRKATAKNSAARPAAAAAAGSEAAPADAPDVAATP